MARVLASLTILVALLGCGGGDDDGTLGDNGPTAPTTDVRNADIGPHDTVADTAGDGPATDTPPEAAPMPTDRGDEPPTDGAGDQDTPTINPKDAADGASAGEVTADASDTPFDAPPASARKRTMVLMGDSWSAGMSHPGGGVFRAALDDRGFTDVALRYEATAVAGSRVAQWAHDPPFVDALRGALDADPPADVLVLVIAGNDYLKAVREGFGRLPGFLQDAALDGIADDLRALVRWAQAGRPDLDVVLFDYDYLHFDMMDLLFGLDHIDRPEFNRRLVDLGRRKLALARDTPRCHYAHNWGWFQHHLGDAPTPPFAAPLVAYDPGTLPAPGVAPDYLPYPGGWSDLPSPLSTMPTDGLHPSAEAYWLLIEHTLDQGLASLLRGEGWMPDP